jgi:hypothetical protein
MGLLYINNIKKLRQSGVSVGIVFFARIEERESTKETPVYVSMQINPENIDVFGFDIVLEFQTKG